MNIINYKAKAYNHNKKIKVTISFEIESEEKEDLQFINRKLGYNEWMMKHVITYCPWDYSYNIDLLADSIDETGKNMIQYGNAVCSVKMGRRARSAARQLRSLQEELIYTDKSLDALTKKFSRRLTNINCASWARDSKMRKIIYERIKKSEDDKWYSTWRFIAKYLRNWWD